MNYDTMTIGRWPARSQYPQQQTVSSPAYRVLFTRGDELLTERQYRGTFDNAIERAIQGNAVNVNDAALAKAFSVSATSYACTEYGASVIGNIPLKVVDLQDNVLEDTPLTYFTTNSGGILADIIRGLWIWGRVYLRKRRNAQGWPTGLEWLNPQKVREINPAHGDQTTVIGYDIELPSHRFESVKPDEIIYIQLFDTDPFGQGISKFEAAWRAVSVEQSMSTYAAAFFINSAQPDGFLSFDVPLQPDQIEDARTEWRVNFKGVKNAHRTAVMPGGARWTPMQAVPKDLAMVELKDSEREDICAIFGVNPVLVGLKGASDPLSANSTFNSAEIAFIRVVAIPLLTTVVLPALNKQWARKSFGSPNYTLAVDSRNIEALSESYLAQSDTAVSLVGATVVDYNEARELLGQSDRYDYYRRNTTEALAGWQGGTITLGQYHKLVGTPDINPLDPNLNVININGQLLPYAALMQVALKNADTVIHPPPPPMPLGGAFGGNTSPQLPSGDSKPPADNPSTAPLLPSGDTTTAGKTTDINVTQRAGMPLTVAVSFAGNQFVRYARRALSDALTSAGVKAGSWTPDDEWRVDLATSDEWTPNAVSAFLRNADYADTRKLDLRTAGYSYHDGAIYLALEGDLSGFQKALAIDTATAHINTWALTVNGIRMATVDAKPESLPSADWPLVANNLTLYLGTAEYHQWNLRGVSAAQTKELTAWRKAIGNKGITYAFKTQALTGHPLTRFVQDALAIEVDTEDRESWITSVFENAERWLKADNVRAYSDTRLQFYETLLRFITDAQANEINRANFAGRMRTALRQFGLMAFRDGMNEVGYDPESFSPQELATFRDWQAQQSAYVTGFGGEIFKQGITETEIDLRANMWSDVSLLEIYYRGIAAGQPIKHMEWVVDVLAEHCDTCLALGGQVHTMQEWVDSGFLPGHNTECGPGCKCGLAPTNKNVQGMFAVKAA